MNTKTMIVTLAVIFAGLVGGAYLAFNTNSQEVIEASTDAKAGKTESSHDWGEIAINGGNVEKPFMIRNDGTDELKLFNVVTSCDCTTAQLTTSGKQSPLFGMHSKSDYVMELAPGEEASLIVVFDPAYHGPSGIGPIMRTVTVDTNDQTNPTLTFTLTGVVRSN